MEFFFTKIWVGPRPSPLAVVCSTQNNHYIFTGPQSFAQFSHMLIMQNMNGRIRAIGSFFNVHVMYRTWHKIGHITLNSTVGLPNFVEAFVFT